MLDRKKIFGELVKEWEAKAFNGHYIPNFRYCLDNSFVWFTYDAQRAFRIYRDDFPFDVEKLAGNIDEMPRLQELFSCTDKVEAKIVGYKDNNSKNAKEVAEIRSEFANETVYINKKFLSVLNGNYTMYISKERASIRPVVIEFEYGNEMAVFMPIRMIAY